MTLDVIDYDWLEISPRAGAVLHAPNLSAAERTQLIEDGYLEEGATACGRRSAHVHIPGIFTRMGAKRCNRCCDLTGYPRGIGSPKNDEHCVARLDELELVGAP